MKLLFRIVWNVFAVFGLMSAIGIVGVIYFDGEAKYSHGIEESRLTSPANEYDAVIIKYESLSSAKPLYELYIVPHGESYERDSLHFQHNNLEANHIGTASVSWKNRTNLMIEHSPREDIRHFHSGYYGPTEYHGPTHTNSESEKLAQRKVIIDLLTKGSGA